MRQITTKTLKEIIENANKQNQREFQLIKRQIKEIRTAIATSKDELALAFKRLRMNKGRPKNGFAQQRGPKITKMMELQRATLITHVTVDLHKHITEITLADAYNVWNDPNNADAWNAASRRKDRRRGYKDITTLYGVVRALAEKNKLNLMKINAV